MPISSGANRWPKSYWTKPQSPKVPMRLIKVAERPSVHRNGRTVSLSSSKLDNGFQSDPSSQASSASPPQPATMRSRGVVVPLTVDRLKSERQDSSSNVRSQHMSKVDSNQTRRVTTYTSTIKETSSSSRTLKRIKCSITVST